MSTPGINSERTGEPGGVPESYPVCRPERDDSIVPLLVVGSIVLLVQRLLRWRARRAKREGGAGPVNRS